ncbi:unnamed protein product [Rotaria sp. Silwood1]|nr:unnamed protein product [Rotaria sp. Silwood1]
MAARTTPASSSELTVVMYIIYTNLTPKQHTSTNISAPSLNRISIPSISNQRMGNSFKNNTNNNQMRERASTILPSSTKTNLVVPIRSSSFGSEQNIGNNIPTERNVEFFKSKLTCILNKASLSHRRESLWERLIASRSDSSIAGRQEVIPIHINEFQALLDSCIGDETIELKTITSLLQRVFNNKEQSERLHRFLRSRYGSQFHTINSSTVHYLDCKRTAHGEPIEEAAASVCLKSPDQIIAVGVNCVHPDTVVPLIKQMNKIDRDFIAYPNAGVTWDAEKQVFNSQGQSIAPFIPSYIDAGLKYVGGCCNVNPSQIRAIRDIIDTYSR